jgi:hypothetical protein
MSTTLRAGRAAALVPLLLFLTLGVPVASAETPATTPLAEVNDEAITAKDIQQGIGASLSQLEEQVYDLKRRELEVLIAKCLFAQEAPKRGMSASNVF